MKENSSTNTIPSMSMTRILLTSDAYGLIGQGGKLASIPNHSTFDVRFDFGHGAVRASTGQGESYCSATSAAAAVCRTLTGSQQND